jgi:hypothetical protein
VLRRAFIAGLALLPFARFAPPPSSADDKLVNTLHDLVASGRADEYLRALYSMAPSNVHMTDIRIGGVPIEEFRDGLHRG